MDIITILLIAVGLAMDAFAVSIASGLSTNSKKRQKYALITASFFGFFQMLMPLIGWSIGFNLQNLIAEVDHWLAFGLLAFIGIKMIYDSTKKEKPNKNASLRLSSLLTLSIATSIDALIVGLSFAFIQTSILVPIIAIGIITFSLSYGGYIFGCALGQFFESKIRILGGIILILIGLKILLDHIIG